MFSMGKSKYHNVLLQKVIIIYMLYVYLSNCIYLQLIIINYICLYFYWFYLIKEEILIQF